MELLEQKRDKDGLTEEEFLARYDASRFERPSVTVDIILFDAKRVLLIKRGGHPFIGCWALPGGFVEPNEGTKTAALRELYEETGLKRGIAIKELGCFSDPNRDPRTRIITVAYTARKLSKDQPKAGDDASEADWFCVEKSGEKSNTVFLGEDGFMYEESVFGYTVESETVRIEYEVKKRATLEDKFGDAVYKAQKISLGEEALAGDHADILAAAIDKAGDF